MADLLEGVGISTIRIPESWDMEADVVVVGFGGAGACAAIEAYDAGADVLILEKMPVPGGTTKRCSGGIYCGGTSLQKELGIEDSPEEVYKFYMAVAHFGGELSADPELARVVADHGPQVFEWCRGLGISFPAHLWEVPGHFHKAKAGLSMTGNELFPEFASVVSPKHRSHWCDGAGVAFFAALEAAVNKRGIKCMFGSPARSLIADSRRVVCGLVAEGKTRSLYIRSKKAVILTAGGHGYNKELAKGLIRSSAAIESPNKIIPYSNTGDGIVMALALGADYWAIDGGSAAPIGFMNPRDAFDTIWNQPRVFVNKDGKRYVNEDWHFSMQAVYLGRQPDLIGWAVIDDKVASTLGKDMIEERIGAREIVRAESVAALAKAIGVDRNGLEVTIAKWNDNVAKGKDTDWNREWGLKPLDTTGPLYATRVVLYEGNERTGVKINTKAQVIDVAGRPIPGLYAAGRTSGGQYGLYPGCGISLMSCLVFGRIAGSNAAREMEHYADK